MNAATKPADRKAQDHGLKRVDASGKFKYPWIQVLEYREGKRHPWLCRNETTGRLVGFETLDDARQFCDQQDLRFYL